MQRKGIQETSTGICDDGMVCEIKASKIQDCCIMRALKAVSKLTGISGPFLFSDAYLQSSLCG